MSLYACPLLFLTYVVLAVFDSLSRSQEETRRLQFLAAGARRVSAEGTASLVQKKTRFFVGRMVGLN